MNRATTYAQAKTREIRPDTTDQHALRQARIAADMAPLTDEEQERARRNWNETKATMPWLAEFVQAFAAKPEFNARRALATMTLRRPPEANQSQMDELREIDFQPRSE